MTLSQLQCTLLAIKIIVEKTILNTAQLRDTLKQKAENLKMLLKLEEHI